MLQEPAPSLQALLALPSSFDWREQGGLTPIKNQGSCGGCWSFGTVAPFEALIKLQTGQTVDLAEQYLINCNMEGWGCNGGWWAHDYHWFKAVSGELPGAVLEAAAPYKARDGICEDYAHPYQLTSWAYVAGQPRPNVQAIKNAIFTYGPVAAAVYVGPKFQAYKSGIFNATESGKVNHAIVLVGWVDDLGPDNGYWILRNSWGTSWGEQGYMKIRYGVNDVGYSANYVRLDTTPTPTPNPDPAPTPDPTPNPDPPPVTTQPDLSGSFGTISTSSSGRTISGSISIKNTGDANAGPFKVILYLSSNGTNKETAIGTASITGLNYGRTLKLSFRRSFTSSVRGKYVIGVIDADGQVAEKSETNNSASKRIP